MAIIRRRQYTDNFTIIDRRALEDDRLSWSTRGILAYLISKPDHWEISVAQLCKVGNLRRDGIHKCLKELIENGYATRSPRRSGKGLLAGWDYAITDLPPCPAPPCTVQPCTANPQQVSTDNKVSTEKDIYSESNAKQFMRFWHSYPVQKGKKPALASWKKQKLDGITDEIIAHVEKRVKTDRQWQEGFIPHGITFVNQRGWEDHYETQNKERRAVI